MVRNIMILAAMAVAVLSGNAQEVRTISVGRPQLQQFGNTGLMSLSAEGCNGYTTTPGEPELPIYRYFFWAGEEASAELVSDSVSTFDLGSSQWIVPVQPPTLKNDDPSFERGYLDSTKTSVYGAQHIALRRIGRKGGNTLWQLTVNPIEYDPSAHELRLHRLQYRLTTSATPKSTSSHRRYQVVMPADYDHAMEPLLKWRRQCGYQVGITHSDGLTPDQIREQLRAISPDYVAVVGDIDVVGSFSGRHNISGLNGHYADLYYGEYTNDYLPEALVGRLTVSDTNELKTVVAKILRYEQMPNQTSRKALLVAGRESRTPAPTTTNGQVNYIGQRLAETDTTIDTICFRNPESDSLRDSIVALLDGRYGLINYTSHCTTTGWDNPDIDYSDVPDSGSLPGIWINNCCSSNRFGSTCMGEQLLRMTGGAVGVIGAGNETLWKEDYFWSVGAKRPVDLHPDYDTLAKGAFDRLADHEASTLGEMLESGNMAVSMSGSPYDAFYWEIYCLLGDPATPLHLGQMPTVALSATTPMTGDRTIEVNTPPGAWTTAMQNGRIIGSGTTPTLSLDTMIDSTMIVLTSTLPYHYPAIDTLWPTRYPGGRLAVTSYTDTTIRMGDTIEMSVRLANVGTLQTSNHRLRLYQSAADSADALMAQNSTCTVGSNAAMSLNIPLTLTRDGRQLMMHLELRDENDSVYASIPIVWEVGHSMIPSTLRLTQEGANAHRLMPNSSYTLRIDADTTGNEPVRLRLKATTLPDGTEYLADTTLAPYAIGSTAMEIRTPQTLQGLRAELTVGDSTSTYWWEAGSSEEDFEGGWHYPWTNASLHPWQADSTTRGDNNHCMRSGSIENDERTDLTLDIDVATADSIGFWLKVSSESNGDYLSFYIDNQQQYYWSGERPWNYWHTAIAAGQHRLTWRYQKNASQTSGSDCAWIDDIRLPFCTWQDSCGRGLAVTDTSTGITLTKGPQWQIYPNPADDMIAIDCPAGSTLTLYDMSGRKIDQIHIEAGHTQYSTQRLRYGTYVLTCSDGSGCSSRKLIINHQ